MNKLKSLITGLLKTIHKQLMRDYSCHTVSFIINAFEKSANFPFKPNTCIQRSFFNACQSLHSLIQPQYIVFHRVSNTYVNKNGVKKFRACASIGAIYCKVNLENITAKIETKGRHSRQNYDFLQ